MKLLRNLVMAGCAGIFAMTSCNSSNDDTPGGFGNDPVKFTSKIATRAVDTQWGNDAIGVYMINNGTQLGAANIVDNAANIKYTTAGTGNFTAADAANPIRMPASGTVDFVAYYPYAATIPADYKYPLNVANQTDPEAIDFMYAATTTGYSASSSNVNLEFDHMLSALRLAVKDETGGALSDLVIEIDGLPTTADFNLADKVIDNTGNIATITAKVTNVSGNTAQGDAILIPQTALAGVKVTFTTGGREYVWPMDTETLTDNTRHNYNVNLKSADGSIVVTPGSNIKGWDDVDEGDVDLNPDAVQGDGTKAKPYLVGDISATNVGETGVWVEGYIVGSTVKTRVVGTPNTENILIAAAADETDEAKCIPVDIASSAVKENLDIVANPELIGKKIKLQGDIVNNIFSNTLSITNVTDQEGGATVPPPPGNDLDFLETFGVTWRTAAGTISKTIADYITEDRFDMKAPIVYSLTDGTEANRLDVRATNGYDNPHLWFAANYDTGFKISGIESGYTGMTLTYDIACNAATKPFNGIMVKCNGVDVTIPDGNTSATTNAFSEVTFSIPDNTTEIIFYATTTSNPTGNGYRIDNIKITGTK